MTLHLRRLKKLKKTKRTQAGFSFQVDWGGLPMAFKEISGLGAMQLPSGIHKKVCTVQKKLPGLKGTATIRLRQGIISYPADYSTLMSSVNASGKDGRDMRIILLDTNHQRIMVWKVAAAWPTKVQATDLNADGNEVAIETIELTHEGICIKD